MDIDVLIVERLDALTGGFKQYALHRAREILSDAWFCDEGHPEGPTLVKTGSLSAFDLKDIIIHEIYTREYDVELGLLLNQYFLEGKHENNHLDGYVSSQSLCESELSEAA